ncbi:MAG: bifunctional phosphopantothenoylcysteine decarboxylase/phosphopantothenate--cysteine ligase CoaBC [Bdellovibrionales bacterium]|nr:bifunctional phosphopantothenoylcysteine decarboxylase/phosphopantothenate--cysteine ligase CoaBC [Bdellovibrionales bacterium]
MPGVAEKRNIVLGVTGSIAAYKSAELARILVSRGYSVRCVMSKSAQEFLGAMTLQSITGNLVATDFWETVEASSIEHIELADWADAIVVAPATADLIAKMAVGSAESPLLATLLATKAPVLIAPAMNCNMYSHPATQYNIELLRERGVYFIDPEEGALACGWNGTGRLADPRNIFYGVRRLVSKGDFAKRKVLVVCGPTREAIDPVRFISNRSSGKMGAAIAKEAYCRGAQVRVVHGPVRLSLPYAIPAEEVGSAVEMRDRVSQILYSDQDAPDILIMAAAVADYRPEEQSAQKLKRSKNDLDLKLVANPDILSEMADKRGDSKRPVLVGFAVETGDLETLLDQAREKLEKKGVDMIVGNFAEDALELDTNRVWMLDRTGRQEEVATTFKSKVANRILDSVLRL